MAITDLDEQLLVRAHQAGDEHAFGQIVRSQHRALYAHAYRRLGSHEAAEDAVQDTLLRAYRALPSFDGDLRLRAWLHRILTNVCHDEGNRRRRQAGLIELLEAQPVQVAPDPVEETVLHDTVRVMSEALAELPESYREALVLRYVDGLSFREVAEVTGISEENARARVHRGRLALHKVLSRVVVMLAFLIPGLRRTQHPPPDAGAAAGAGEPGVALVTQLTSHAINVAPAMSRVAEVAVATSGTKTSMVATAVAAVAAVAAPVAVYTAYDSSKTPSAPPAAVAQPADEEPAGVTPSSIAGAGDAAVGTTTTAVDATTTTLPASAVAPFAGPGQQRDETTTTTSEAPATTTTTVPVDDGGGASGALGSDAIDVGGARPDFDVAGPAILQGSGDPVAGALGGRAYVADTVGGDAIMELVFALDDGRQLRVRLRGVLDGEEVGDGATTWRMSGAYSIPGGAAVGVAESGTARVVFRHVEDGASALQLELRGEEPSGV